jgi:hypothetical protein
VEPPIFSVVRQGFVARVDNRPVKLDPLINIVNDMIRPLADLEWDMTRPVGNLEVECERIGLPDSTRAGKDLSSGQECEERSQDLGCELGFSPHQIIFVTPKGSAGVMVDIVL